MSNQGFYTQEQVEQYNSAAVTPTIPISTGQEDDQQDGFYSEQQVSEVEEARPVDPSEQPYVSSEERIEVAREQEAVEPTGIQSIRDLEADDELVQEILQYREDRFGVSKDEGAANLLTAAFVGPTQELTNENIIDDFLDHHRFLITNTMNATSEIGWLNGLKEKEQAAREAGNAEMANNYAEQLLRARRLYMRADAVGGFFDEKRFEGMNTSQMITDIAGTAGAYTMAVLSDPLTLVTAGVGRVVAGGAATAGQPLKAAIMAAATAAPLEGGAAAVTDLVVQNAEIEMGVRDEVDLERTATVAGVSAATAGIISGVGARNSAKKVDKVTRGDMTEALKNVQKQQTVAAQKANAKMGIQSDIIRERLAKGIEDVYGKEAIKRDKNGKVTGLNSKVIRESDYAGRIKEELDLDPDLVEPSLSFSTFERVTASTGEVMEAVRNKKLKFLDGTTGKEIKEFSAPLQKNEMVSERLLNILSRVDGESHEEVAKILGRYGITQRELAATLFADASWAGKRLRSLRELSDVVGRAARSKTIGEAAEEAEAAAEQSFGSLFRRLEDIRRLTLVSGVATAVRNNFSQVLRSGVELPVYAMEAGIHTVARKLFKADAATKRLGFRSTFAQLEHTFYDQKDAATIAQFMLDMHDNQKARFYNQFSEVKNYLNKKNPAQKSIARSANGLGNESTFLDKWEGAVHSFNYLNRLQEAMYRNGMFTASLQRQMFDQGKDLMEVLNSGRITENISEAMVTKAVDDALEFTYASQPKWKPFRVLNNMIVQSGATLAIPFPRFMFKAIEMTYNYNVTGVGTATFRMANAALRGKPMTDGMFRQLAEGIAGGTPLLALGYYLRDPDGPTAGSDWYYLKDGMGNEFDARPFFPLTPYLLFGEIMHRFQDDRPSKFRWKEAVEGLTGANFRGTGAAGKMMEDIVAWAASGDDEMAFTIGMKEMGKYLGEALTGYGQPVYQFADIFSPMDERMRDYKNDPEYGNGLQAFFGGVWEPFESRLKRVGEAAGFEIDDPWKEDPRFDAVPERVMPFMKILFGATLTRVPPKYVTELNRLGFTYVDFMSKTNSAELDRSLNREMGLAMQEEMPIFLATMKQDPKMLNKDGSVNNNYMRAELKNTISTMKSLLYAQMKLKDAPAMHQADLQRFRRLGPAARNAAIDLFKQQYDGKQPDFNKYEDVAQLLDFGKNQFSHYSSTLKAKP
tara:strand:- start:393 stop:3992 length:3600 start_codon:yes stop_codon:yes gene_type:complete